MEQIVATTARFVQAFIRASEQKFAFLALFVTVFIASYALLDYADLLPQAPAKAPTVALTASAASATTTVSIQAVESPVKIAIPAISLSATIANPTTTNATVLDSWLLKGAVRYPSSAMLGETGNVVLFGHSSYLPIVNNQAYKTFDGIQKLKKGDLITVYSDTAAYTYSVESVQKENAGTGAIPLTVSGKVLTLATCNSFATKDDRFVVTANFVESHSLGA